METKKVQKEEAEALREGDRGVFIGKPSATPLSWCRKEKRQQKRRMKQTKERK